MTKIFEEVGKKDSDWDLVCAAYYKSKKTMYLYDPCDAGVGSQYLIK